MDRRPLRLAEHLVLASRALEAVYGVDYQADAERIEAEIVRVVSHAGVPARGSAVVLVCFFPHEFDLGNYMPEGLGAGAHRRGPELSVSPELSASPESVSGGWEGASAGAAPTGFRVVFERVLLERGGGWSSLRPRGVTFDYSIPYAAEPIRPSS